MTARSPDRTVALACSPCLIRHESDPAVASSHADNMFTNAIENDASKQLEETGTHYDFNASKMAAEGDS